jgi:hypothetical protein
MNHKSASSHSIANAPADYTNFCPNTRDRRT